MANGPIGRVAPTQAQQGGTYSDAINQQVDLIQRQRAANLQNRLAQEKENRKFRDEQRQNIYDFDVTGLAPEYAEQIKKTQEKMSEWLRPGSEVRYENQEQLTKDIANLNNMYLWGKRFSTTAHAAEAQFEDTLVNGSSVPGTKMAEGENALMNRRDAFNTGGFKNMEVTGGPGGISIIGIPIEESPEGGGAFMFNEESQKVDVLSREADGSFVFRTPLVKDLYNVDQKYVDATSAEMAGKKANSDWDSNPRSVQLEYREKLADSDRKFAQKDDQGEFVVSDEELKEMHRKEAEDGWNTFHETQLPASLLGGSDVLTEYGAATKLTDPKTGKDRTVSLYTGGETRKVNHIGFRGQGENTEVFYVYQDPNDPNQYFEAVVPYNSAEGFSLINDAGAIGTIAQLVGNADLTLEELKASVEEAPAATEGAPEGEAATTTEGEGGEGTGEGGEGTEAEEQQATPAPDTIGDYRAALDEMATPTGLGFGFQQSREQKLAAEIQNEPLATQITRIDEEIAALEKEIENTPSRRRSQGAFQGKLNTLERLKALKEKQKGLDTSEAKTARIDAIESRMADIDVELLELQGRGTQKARDRRKLEEEKTNLRGEISQLDPDYYAATQIPSERPNTSTEGSDIAVEPPADPLPLLQAAPQNDWYNFGEINENITSDQRSMIGYLVEDHGITPQAAVALTSVTAKESAGEAAKKEESYYATGKRADGTEMNSLEQMKGIFKSSMGDNAPNPLTQAELDEERSKGKESFDAWFFDRVYGADTKMGKGLGNTQPGDGYKFRGRGLIQFTGRTLYAQASEFLFGDPNVLLNNPEILAENPNLGARAAAWYLMRNGELKESELANRENLSKEDALALADSSYALVAGKSAFTTREELEQRKLYPSGSAGQRAWLNIN